MLEQEIVEAFEDAVITAGVDVSQRGTLQW